MGKTSIEWCDQSINPIRADRTATGSGPGHYCEKISPGCANCYASTLQKRFRMPDFGGATAEERRAFYEANGQFNSGVRPYLDEAKLAEIRKRKKPTRYFVGDMTDVFGWWVPDEWLDAMFATFAESPQHTFMLLTKRPDRMRSYLHGEQWSSDPAKHPAIRITHYMRDHRWPNGFASGPPTCDLPLPNVWLGVSAEDQKRWDERVPILAQTPAAVRFVSVEPMLERIDMSYPKKFYPNGPEYCCSGHECGCHGLPYDPPMLYGAGIDWVIFGGESGRGARPCNVEWIRDGLAQCKAAGVPAFVKQLGAKPYEARSMMVTTQLKGGYMIEGNASSRTLDLTHSKGGDPAEWPEDLRVRDFPR